MAWSDITARLRLDISDFSRNLRQASVRMSGFADTLEGRINPGLEQANKDTYAWGLNLRSVSRVVSGIIIAQVFYKGLGAIQSATSAVWEFSQELEYAKVAYSNLFNDTALAEEFIAVLEDFAAKTPFSFTESEAAAKRLLAYGIQYKNVMYVMNGVLAAASMQGDSSKVEQISRALGQIYTKGRLMNEEMRQLAEAGIPAYEILQDKLGLTQKQLQNLGREAIPASIAINALVDGMNERFGTTLEASSKTLSGIISNIKDNATMLGAAVADPLVGRIKAVLNVVGELLFELRSIEATSGVGGVFERLIPPEMQQTIRQFIANLQVLWNIIKMLAGDALNVFKWGLYGIITAFNILSPVIMTVINIIANLLRIITENATIMRILTGVLIGAATAWLIFKTAALGTLILAAVAKVIAAVGVALNFLAAALVANPIISLLVLLTAVLVGVAIAATGAGNAISALFAKLTAFNGGSTSILQPISKSVTVDYQKFNEQLDDMADAASDTADSTDDIGKAAKRAARELKNLLSFDEVFKLNEESVGTGGYDSSSVDDLYGMLDDVNNLSDLISDAFIPEVPDLSGFADDYISTLFSEFASRILGGTVGALLGGLIGMLLGGPMGAAIGALAGGIVGLLWEDIADFLGLTPVGAVALPLSTALGAAIGAIVAGPFGAIVGAGIGILVGWLIDRIAHGIETGDWGGIIMPISIGIGGAIGLVVGGPGGAVIGAAIGALVGWIGTLLYDGFVGDEFDIQGLSIAFGTTVGATIGAIIGGPGGAIIGAAIGSLVGWIGFKLEEAFAGNEWGVHGLPLTIGTAIGGVIGMVVGGPGGALIGAVVGALVGWIGGLLYDGFVNNTWNASGMALSIGTTIGGIIGMVVGGPPGALIGAVIGALVGWLGGKIYDGIENNSWDKSGMAISISALIGGVIGLIFGGPIGGAIGTAIGGLVGWMIDGFIDTFGDDIARFGEAVAQKIAEVIDGAKKKIQEWRDSVRDFFGVEDASLEGYGSSSHGFSVSNGHATGGIFNREHVARFAEGNKPEAIIPLDNDTAMQPFVNAVANGLTSTLAPLLATQQDTLQPLYVGTLIADDRSLKELERKMQIIRRQEERRS